MLAAREPTPAIMLLAMACEDGTGRPSPHAPPRAPRPMAPRPMAARPMAPRPMAPRPMAPRPMAPGPMAPGPMAPRPTAPAPPPTPAPLQVKNVTGRLLVGLRWWNDASASESGTAWRFESLSEGQREISPHERRWFWIVLVAAPVLWALSALTAFLGLDWGEQGPGAPRGAQGWEGAGRGVSVAAAGRSLGGGGGGVPPSPSRAPLFRLALRPPPPSPLVPHPASLPAHPHNRRHPRQQQPRGLLQVLQGGQEAAAEHGHQHHQRRDAEPAAGRHRARLAAAPAARRHGRHRPRVTPAPACNPRARA
jgi:hypothetical protein